MSARSHLFLFLLLSIFVASVASKQYGVDISIGKIHEEVMKLLPKLSFNFLNLRKDAKRQAVARLEDTFTRREATKAWVKYTHGIATRQAAASPLLAPPMMSPPPNASPPQPPSPSAVPPSPLAVPPSPSAVPPSPSAVPPSPSAKPPSPLAVPPSPSAKPPSSVSVPANDFKSQYPFVLNLTLMFYMAQRAGEIPPNYPIKWTASSFLSDPVQPGFFDAGDTLKLNFPLSGSVSFLAWGLVDLRDTYQKLGLLDQARNVFRPAVEYLLNSYIGYRQYIGQIGDPDNNHNFWGRPSEYPIDKYPRQAYIWNETTKHQADLLGSVAAALASSSMAYKEVDPAFAAKLKEKAIEIFEWGTVSEGLYSSVYPNATKAYPSSDWADDMAWAAAWLYRVTNDRAYLDKASNYFNKQYGNVYSCWDSKYGPTAAMMLSLSDTGVSVPGIESYKSWWDYSFSKAWLTADGYWSIVRTPKGLTHPSWSKWGNLRYANTAGLVMAMRARTNPNAAEKAAELAFTRSQIEYAMGSSGRSYIVGFGKNFPLQPHHAAASCPDLPATCDWAQFSSPDPNPQILHGGMVAGPEGALTNPVDPDNTYTDVRSDYISNEVGVDYTAALTGALVAAIGQL